MNIYRIAIIFCILLFLSDTARMANATNISKCGTLDATGETYTLTANVSTNDSICFKITEANITIDCSNFSITINNDLNVGGIYSYQSDSIEKNCNIPISTPFGIIENQNKATTSTDSSKKALFDIVLDIVTEPKNAGEDLIVKVSLVNFGTPDQIDANLTYTISDSGGKIVKQYNKIVPVTTQTEFLENLSMTGMTNGKYTLKINLTYTGQSFPAYAEKIFYVGAIQKVFENISNVSTKTFILPIIAIALLLGVYRKSRINKLKEATTYTNNNKIDNNNNTSTKNNINDNTTNNNTDRKEDN